MYKADIFALGVILFTLVLGRLPFEYATPDNSHYGRISTENFSDFWKMHEQVCVKLAEAEGSNVEDFKQIFQLMVQEDANKRPGIEEILECSWLKGKQEIIKSMPRLPEASTVAH